MKSKLIALAAVAGALAWGAAPALADTGGAGGAGGYQAGVQAANTSQWAGAVGASHQNAVNANVPVSIAGGTVTGGTSTANQDANSAANATASNDASTNQGQTQTQNVGGGSCSLGCGGAG